MKNPNLQFYVVNKFYDKNVISSNKFLYTFQGNNYADLECTQLIGNFSASGTHTSINDINVFFEEILIILSEGTITATISGNEGVDNTGKFITNNIFYARIINGTGNFLFAKGYIIIKAIDEQTRSYNVCFDNFSLI